MSGARRPRHDDARPLGDILGKVLVPIHPHAVRMSELAAQDPSLTETAEAARVGAAAEIAYLLRTKPGRRTS